jgi:hypothetical protein
MAVRTVHVTAVPGLGLPRIMRDMFVDCAHVSSSAWQLRVHQQLDALITT